jgi:hypothetical protein
MSLNHDRVRAHTAQDVLRRIDEQTTSRLAHCASAEPEAIGRRLDDLDREWDTDRAIELEASLMGLAGLSLGVFVRPALLALPMFVGSAVLLHALTGWYPLLPLFRRVGLRTAREIGRERYALKALRGDFSNLEPANVVRGGATTAAVSPPGSPRIQ